MSIGREVYPPFGRKRDAYTDTDWQYAQNECPVFVQNNGETEKGEKISIFFKKGIDKGRRK
jgi:hypothetical protein